MNAPLTPKQLDFFLSKDRRLTFLCGAVRSGKTYVSCIKFVYKVLQYPKDYVFLIAGKTLTTLDQNVLALIKTMCGDDFTYSLGGQKGRLYGRRIILRGANDEAAASKIQGMTLGGAYCDEVTLFPRSFFSMLLSRLSLPNAFLYATCNPDNPNHYIKTGYIDNRDIASTTWTFRLDDNTFLTQEFKDSISSELSGMFYRRYVLGEWCISDGLVYQEYAEATDAMTLPAIPEKGTQEFFRFREDYSDFAVGCDYGIVNAQVFLVCGFNRHTQEWEALDEYYYDGHTSRQLTDTDYYQALEELGRHWTGIRNVYIDPSAKSLFVLINSHHRFRAVQANNSVLDGISFVSTMLHIGKLKIRENCVNLRKELQSYSWDTDASMRQGVDRPVKQDDHAVDALRYALATHVRPHASRYGINLVK